MKTKRKGVWQPQKLKYFYFVSDEFYSEQFGELFFHFRGYFVISKQIVWSGGGGGGGWHDPFSHLNKPKLHAPPRYSVSASGAKSFNLPIILTAPNSDVVPVDLCFANV